MSIRTTLVNYSHINSALSQSPGTITEATHNQAEQEAANPVEAAAIVTSLSAALDELEALERYSDVMTSPDHMVASLLQSYLAERANAEGKIELQSSGLEEAKFDENDWLGWAGSFFSWWRGIEKHAWRTPPAAPEPLHNTTRVALLGDWGTGLYGAPVSAKTIEQDQNGYGLLMHLGDVYYSGAKDEVEERFLNFWPKNNRVISRAINSNHEMYTGGHAYFTRTLPRFQQSASYFAFQNDYWTLVGLDSAYDNPHRGGLTDDQITWLRGILQQAEGRKVMLFSHHQAFAWLETAKGQLAEQLGEFLRAKNIFAWYWGHEHRCVLYDQHPGWGLYGRCIGHSGYPYFRDRLSRFVADPNLPKATWRRLPSKNLIPAGIVLDGPNPYIEGHEEEYGTQGHMTLEIDGEHLTEIIHLPDGTRIYERPLV